jgi:hypothetical protein
MKPSEEAIKHTANGEIIPGLSESFVNEKGDPIKVTELSPGVYCLNLKEGEKEITIKV